MADYLEIFSVTKDRTGKDRWHRLGVLFPSRDGYASGASGNFDVLPIPALNDKGALECRIVCRPPKPRDDAPQQRRDPAPRGGYSSDLDDSDSIPF